MQSLTAGLELAGRFRLIRLLGRGGRGEVWLAQTVADSRRVALKFPAGEAATVEALRAEFDQARRLVHPGIVRVQELVAGPPPFVFMDYVEGTTLGALRGSGYRAVVKALIPVAEALEYAHRQGVVHRDLKPSNILRDARGRSLIADFGVASRPGGGSLPAMSPQQCDGEAPTVSDDVYGFGSLLYDLIAGQPLFHPDVTPERIRSEIPVVPAADLTGEALPKGLRLLLGSLLQKSPQQRPPAMGAVRDALEEMARENGDDTVSTGANVIRPRDRSRPPEVPGQRQATPGSAPAVALPSARPGLRTPFVYGGLALLVPIALLVVVYLPSVVRERGPLVRVDAPAPATTGAAAGRSAAHDAPAAPAPVPQAVLDETLGEFLHSDDELRKVGADKWGGPDWVELRRLAQAGDDANRVRDSGAALAGYRAANELAKRLLARAPEVLAGALRSGAAALKAGDQAQAIAQFQTALSVAGDNAEARRGLERAQKLDQVLAFMNQANAAESAGHRGEALAAFRRAAALDPAWSEAGAGIARLEQAAARETYETQMARGFAAQAGKDLATARGAFEAALQARPGDAQAKTALAQLDTDQKLGRLVSLEAEARSLEQQERWADASRRYEAVLAEDANLQEAQQGLARARSRADLDDRLRRELGNADQLNDDTVFRKASALLESARAVQDPGPVLSRQVVDLDRLLQVAAKPVPVQLESDNLTEVTVFKVGRLGVFSSKTLELRPGAYVAVGSRPGYRDVRLNFRVGPGADGAPVVVRCEETI